MPIRLAVVDGHTLIRYGLQVLAAQHDDIEIVAECGSAAEAPALIAAARPDVVTVAVGLPDGDGLRLAREFRDRFRGLGIVVLTSQDQDDVLFRALETGVSAFVAKTAPVQELLAAIRHAAVAASSFTAAGLATALSRRQAAGEERLLSRRETEVLRLLRDGLSIPAIATAMVISQSTAKTYVARLYTKLGAANRAQALVAAMHYGLIRYEQAPPARRLAGGARELSAACPGALTARRRGRSRRPGPAGRPRAVPGIRARTRLAAGRRCGCGSHGRRAATAAAPVPPAPPGRPGARTAPARRPRPGPCRRSR